MSKPLKVDYRCGMVSIVGRPNVGKSTLLNTIVEEKVSIVSPIPQTTRNQIRGIYNDKRGQIIFIDTPGLHIGKDRLDKFMNKTSSSTMNDADCIVYLVDPTRKVGPEEEEIAHRLKTVKSPLIMALNKIDLKPKYLPDYIALWEKVKGKPVQEMENFMMITLSGRKGTQVDQLLDIIFGYLPIGPALYPLDIVSDVPQKMIISDIIREKLLGVLRDELPHSVGVIIEQMESRRGKATHITAQIMVEKDSQKEIVIGKGGNVLKKVGTQARLELEDLLGNKVFLELYVKTYKHWRDDLMALQEQGYDEA
jgi:GTP-binding protein Era